MVAWAPRFPRYTDAEAAVMPSGRALLRLNGLHGCVIDGLGFNGGLRASACVQITGNNARASVFRNCTFASARNVLMQVGDYLIEHPDPAFSVPVAEHPLPMAAPGIRGGWDLSGLGFENCVFDSSQIDATVDPYALSGLVFHANNTLPMTMDGCTYIGPMAACVEAYGGTVIIRGGGAQNQLKPKPFVQATNRSRDKPRGGVDLFLGDVMLPSDVPDDGQHLPLIYRAAISPTGLTVQGVESQSQQFLDTFRHHSASYARVPFLPVTLTSVSARCTDSQLYAPESVFWSGPGLRVGDPIAYSASARSSTLTLVGCTFGGVRVGTADIPQRPDLPPSGSVIADSMVSLVGDVDARVTYDAPSVFYQFDRMASRYTAVPYGGGPMFYWYKALR